MGLDAFHKALKTEAEKMPRGGPRSLDASNPLLETLAGGRFTIHLDEDARARHLQRVLQICAAFDVQIWDVELSSSDRTNVTASRT